MKTTEDTTTSKKQRVIALMSPEALKCVAAARPTVKHALTGTEIHCRSLGKVEGMQQLDQSEVMPDDMIIGFSIPINLSARAHHCVEIPVGKAEKGFNPRMEASGRLNTERQKLLIEKLNETGRFALRAYRSEITTAFPDDKDDVPEETQAEMTVEF